MKLFLDPDKTLSTCNAESCEVCNVASKLVCHFSITQLLFFIALALPLFIIGGVVIVLTSPLWMVGFLVLFVVFFTVVEIRVVCCHCPHYAEDGKTLKCWANHGSPKLWKYRPGPMYLWEKIVFLGGFFVLVLYPVPFFVLSSLYWLLAIYAFLLGVFAVVLRSKFCTRCINFACPLNRVDEKTRHTFREKNPKTWC